ncbi:MAG TPA: class I SAM-dependent methyltransferase, partial [Candidatus Acidoferrum sp.]|nr:class I SAM-dependent methyltransferase [Candidatus Acidoferrum sp.]
MSKPTSAQRLYDARSRLYHFIFFTVLRYGSCVESFLKSSNYIRADMKILDAGCGSGLCTKLIYHIASKQKISGIIFNAFDISKTMLDGLQKWVEATGAKGVEVKQADVMNLQQLPAGWSHYDLTISSAMLEYIPKANLTAVLKDLKTLNKPTAPLILFITKQSWTTCLLVQKMWHA